ncbi:MAG: GC-type dockerin domain-anchored protein [Planctomycetota bacterium]
MNRSAGGRETAALAGSFLAALTSAPSGALAQGGGGAVLVATDSAFGSPQVYRIDPRTGEVLSQEPLTGTGALGPTPLSGLVRLASGKLVGFTPSTDNSAYRIDVETGAAVRLGPLRLGAREGGLTQREDGTIIGASTGSPPRLFTMDAATGRARAAATLDRPADISGLLTRSDGAIIGLDLRQDPGPAEIIEINADTGATETLAVIAADGPLASVGGMTLLGGVGYFTVAGDGLGARAELWSFDPFTGDQRFIATLDGVAAITGLAIAPPPPCRVDLDGDGRATFFDVLRYMELFELRDPLADVTGDGSIDLFDFVAFLDAIEAGC